MGRSKHKNKASNDQTISSLNEIDLIKLGVLSTLLSLSGSFTFLESANKAQNVEYAHLQGIEPPVIHPTSSELVVIGAVLGLFGNIIFAPISYIRLKQREQAIINGTDTNPLDPNINILIGAVLGLVGSVFLTVGAVQRQQQDRITII